MKNLTVDLLHSIKPNESIDIRTNNISHSNLVSKVFNWAVVHSEYGFSIHKRYDYETKKPYFAIRIKNRKESNRYLYY